MNRRLLLHSIVATTAAEETLWESMTTPLDLIESEKQLLTLDIPPDSVTLLRLIED